jgi:large subunit ribosomal protein L17
MATSLFRYERIKTTKAKALAIRRTAEKMITKAKNDSLHNRRMVGRDIKDQAVLAKLFTDIGPRYKSRPGGYTRILKLGHRQGDAAEMVLLELVGEEVTEDTKKSKKGEKKASAKKSGKKEAPAAAPEESTEKRDSGEAAEEPVEQKTEEGSEAQADTESSEENASDSKEDEQASSDSEEEKKEE